MTPINVVFRVLFCELSVSFPTREKGMVCLETDAKHVHMYLLNLTTRSSEQQSCYVCLFVPITWLLDI